MDVQYNSSTIYLNAIMQAIAFPDGYKFLIYVQYTTLFLSWKISLECWKPENMNEFD